MHCRVVFATAQKMRVARRCVGLLPAGRVRAVGTHVGADGVPRMVDITAKAATARTATAEATIYFPPPVAAALNAARAKGDGDGLRGFSTKKGPVFTTAVIAATQAVKQCGNVIPFCHPLPIERCDVVCESSEDGTSARLTVTVGTTHKTGVEMEAMYGASVAALTVYDMLKGIDGAQPGMHVATTRLLRKTGGKSDVAARDSSLP